MSDMESILNELPKYTASDRNKELGRPDEVKKKAFQNDLSVQLNRLMNHFRIEQADIVKGTNGVGFSTLHNWTSNKVDSQLLDSNIKEVARYFGVTIDFLCYATAMSERDFEIEKAMDEDEEKRRTA